MCSDGDTWGRFKPKRAPYRHAPAIPAWKQASARIGRWFLKMAETKR